LDILPVSVGAAFSQAFDFEPVGGDFFLESRREQFFGTFTRGSILQRILGNQHSLHNELFHWANTDFPERSLQRAEWCPGQVLESSQYVQVSAGDLPAARAARGFQLSHDLLARARADRTRRSGDA